MTSEERLRAAIVGATDVTDIIGTKIYNESIPQNKEPPFAVYQRVGTEVIPTIHGTVAYEIATLRVICYAESRPVAEDVANKMVAAVLPEGFMLSDRSGGYVVDIDMHSALLVLTHYN